MLNEVAALAVYRYRDNGARPAIHLYQLVACRMARDMHEVIGLCDHLDTARLQIVIYMIDCLVIARNNLGRENHEITRLQRDTWVGIDGDLGQGSARLSLTSGGQNQ